MYPKIMCLARSRLNNISKNKWANLSLLSQQPCFLNKSFTSQDNIESTRPSRVGHYVTLQIMLILHFQSNV